MDKIKRDCSFDILRFVSICAVVMIHISSRLQTDPFAQAFVTGNIFNSVSRFAVPVFMMITGALLLDEKRDISYKNVFSKYINRALLLFVLWSAAYTLLFQILTPLKNGASPVFSDVATSFLKGHYHMWYLYSLVGFYAVLPLFRKLTKKGNEKKVLTAIIILVIIQSLLPLADLAVKQKVGFSLMAIYAQSGIRTLLGFHFYFLLGWLLSTVKMKRGATYTLYFLGGLSLFVTVIFTQLISQKKGIAYTKLYDNLYLNTVVFSVAVFVLFRNLFKNKKRIHPFIFSASKLSFGIYILHPIILEIFCEKSFMPKNPLLYVIALFVITSSVSYILCFIISKIPIAKKLIRT